MSNFRPIDGLGRPILPAPSENTSSNDNRENYASAENGASGTVTRQNSEATDSHDEQAASNGSVSARTAETSQSSSSADRGSDARPSVSKEQAQTTLRSILTRLDNLEKGTNGPFAKVNNALHSIETARERLTTDLSQKYEENLAQMQQHAQHLCGWQSGLKVEVEKYCDERNGQLHESVQQITQRVDVLEGLQYWGGEHEKRCEERIGTVHQAMETLDACTTNGFERVDGECQQRHDKSMETIEAVSARLAKLEGSVETAAESERGYEQRLSDIEAAFKHMQDGRGHADEEVRSHERRLEGLENALRAGKEQTAAEKTERERLLHTIKRVRDRLDGPHREGAPSDSEQVGSRSAVIGDTHRISQEASDALESKIQVLDRKITAFDKAHTKRFDFLTTKLPGINENYSQRLARASASAASQQETTTAHVGTPSSRRDTWTSGIMTEVLAGVSDLRARVAKIEQASLGMALDKRFSAMSERMSKLDGRVTSMDNREQVSKLSERIERVGQDVEKHVGNKADDALAEEQREIRRRLDILEDHARTSASSHDTTRSQNSTLEDRIRTLEQSSKDLVHHVEANVDDLKARLVDVQEKTSLQVLERMVGAESVKQMAPLSELSARVGSLEGEARSTSSSTQKSVQDIDRRIVKLDEKSVAAAKDPRFDTLTEQLAKMREDIASRVTHASLLALTTPLEKGLQEACNADRIGRASLEEVKTKIDKFGSELKENDAAVVKVAQDTAWLTAVHREFEKQLGGLKGTSERTRDWMQRVGEKSKSDDQAIVARIQNRDTERGLQSGSSKDQPERLEDDVTASLRRARSVARQRSESEESMEDEVRRLRRRPEDSGPVQETGRQLSELSNMTFDESSPACTTKSTQPSSSRLSSPVDRAESTQRQRPSLKDMSRDTVTQPVAKRRRINSSDRAANKEPGQAARQTATPGEDGSDGEAQAPRRSDRKGKGRNEWLKKMPGMDTGIAWKNSTMRQAGSRG